MANILIKKTDGERLRIGIRTSADSKDEAVACADWTIRRDAHKPTRPDGTKGYAELEYEVGSPWYTMALKYAEWMFNTNSDVESIIINKK